MHIVKDDTPTSDLTAIKVGDQISNGIGTFGAVEAIQFTNTDASWSFIFNLVGGGLIQVTKVRNVC